MPYTPKYVTVQLVTYSQHGGTIYTTPATECQIHDQQPLIRAQEIVMAALGKSLGDLRRMEREPRRRKVRLRDGLSDTLL